MSDKNILSCAAPTGGVQCAEEMKGVSPREQALLRYLRHLAADARHAITVICRGPEPWEIEAHVEKRRIELKP